MFVIFIVNRLWYGSISLPMGITSSVDDIHTIGTASNTLIEDEYTEF